jgi:uncharacterized protein YqgV (UPF0045/DUF77 family)
MIASAQISVYPLRQERLDRAIAIVHAALAARGLEPQIGAMSTIVAGDSDLLFVALSEAGGCTPAGSKLAAWSPSSRGSGG